MDELALRVKDVIDKHRLSVSLPVTTKMKLDAITNYLSSQIGRQVDSRVVLEEILKEAVDKTFSDYNLGVDDLYRVMDTGQKGGE